jgi:hypothetical protein
MGSSRASSSRRKREQRRSEAIVVLQGRKEHGVEVVPRVLVAAIQRRKMVLVLKEVTRQ